MLWLIRSSSLEIQTCYLEESLHEILSYCAQLKATDAIGALLDLSPRGSVDTFGDLGYSALYLTAARQHWALAITLLTMGADPHLSCIVLDVSPRSETPISIAMYSSWRFWSFRDILSRPNVDIEYYIHSGLGQAGPLINDGWQEETLRVLFQYEFEPESSRPCDHDWKCSHGQVYHVVEMVEVEPRWQLIIERIKRGIDADALSLEASDVERVQESSVESRFTITSQPSDSNIRNDDDPSSEPPSSGFKAAQVVPTSPAIDLDVPPNLLERNAVVCIRCWLYLKEHGHLPPQEPREVYSDDTSEDEFSPFHIHA